MTALGFYVLGLLKIGGFRTNLGRSPGYEYFIYAVTFNIDNKKNIHLFVLVDQLLIY